jgi:hypothetical protein
MTVIATLNPGAPPTDLTLSGSFTLLNVGPGPAVVSTAYYCNSVSPPGAVGPGVPAAGSYSNGPTLTIGPGASTTFNGGCGSSAVYPPGSVFYAQLPPGTPPPSQSDLNAAQLAALPAYANWSFGVRLVPPPLPTPLATVDISAVRLTVTGGPVQVTSP